ncbi:MAG: hypothetical protein WDO14_12165 [Bacteroidota bacterium]
MWPIEEIPNPDFQFLRVHDSHVVDGFLIPGAFREHGEGDQKGLSTDWIKYSTAAQSRNRANNPAKTSIVSMITGLIRYYDLTVTHAPLVDNRAHVNTPSVTDNPKRRLKLMGLCDWEIKSDFVNSF